MRRKVRVVAVVEEEEEEGIDRCPSPCSLSNSPHLVRSADTNSWRSSLQTRTLEVCKHITLEGL